MKLQRHPLAALAIGLIAVIVLVLLAKSTLLDRAIPTPQGQYAKDSNEEAYYYRLTANYMHGEEPVDFDIVVGCKIHVTAYRDNERSYDAVRDPLIFAKATRDGGAIMQMVPDACRGETTANGDVPKDLLPGAIWFDSKDDFSFGVGYVTEDAYENPRSKLKFLGAEIRAASQVEWESFRPIAATNLMSSWIYTYGSLVPKPTEAEIKANLWNIEKLKVWLPWLRCHGIERVRLTDEAERAKAAEFRPVSKLKYWRLEGPPIGGESRMQLIATADGKDDIAVGNKTLSDFTYSYSHGKGFPTKAGGGRLYSGGPGTKYAPEVLPVRSPRALRWLDRSVGNAPIINFDVDADGDRNLGFVYCYSEILNGRPIGDLHLPDYLSRRFMTRIDGDPVFVADGGDSARSQGPSAKFFEDDQFYYFGVLEFSF